MLVIRKKIKDDTEEIQSLLYKTWLQTYPNKSVGVLEDDIHELFKSSFSKESILKKKKFFKNQVTNKFYYVCTDKKKLIGVAFLEISNTNKLRSIYVLPEYQNRGVGKKLWKKVSKHIDPTKEIIVHVATYNKKAIAFYEKLGFVDTGKRFTEERHRMPVSGVLIPEMEMLWIKK